ncbi:GATS-like protein 2 isoform X2 [Orbicella faveolata]|uniref:GATS-like protein 2 isoform X2 n=1 Tax=Orbicella faveolata TaxID=48498 RepID=UPI0009E1CB02|nr:GATS-like protein 2 isoform X2 [Orbicella faveolata]
MLPSLATIILDLMFYSKTPVDEHYEPFFHISIVEGDISLVLDSEALSRFPEGSLYTNTNDEGWKMIRVGDAPLGFEESGIVAQLSEPLTDALCSSFYICTFLYDHLLVPENEIDKAIELLNSLRVT